MRSPEPGCRDPAFARGVERLVGAIPGVERANVGGWTASLLIYYSPAVIDSPRLLRLVEEILDDSSGWGASLPQPTRTRFGSANTTLSIAAAGEYLVPILVPVSAVMLVAMNVRTFRYAWLQVQRRKFGLPVLYTAIIAATLVSGQFLASALMYWFFTFWHGRLRIELAGERRRLLDECLPRPSFTSLITPEGGEVLVPIDRLRAGDRVAVGADETVPADGRVIGGEGIVDERSVRGLQGASRKRAGDAVLAGSTVLAGSLRIEVARLGEQTQASSIVRDLIAATSPAAGPMSPLRHEHSHAGTGWTSFGFRGQRTSFPKADPNPFHQSWQSATAPLLVEQYQQRVDPHFASKGMVSSRCYGSQIYAKTYAAS